MGKNSRKNLFWGGACLRSCESVLLASLNEKFLENGMLFGLQVDKNSKIYKLFGSCESVLAMCQRYVVGARAEEEEEIREDVIEVRENLNRLKSFVKYLQSNPGLAETYVTATSLKDQGGAVNRFSFEDLQQIMRDLNLSV